MRVRVLFFGVLKDITGRAEDSLEVPSGSTLGSVFEHYAARHPRLRDLRPSIVLARNQQFALDTAALSEDDEVALLPPVSGGAGPWTRLVETREGHLFALTRERIDVEALKRRIVAPEDGAAVVFEGVARNNSRGRRTLRLDYECYEPMAIRTMHELGCEIARAHAVSRIAIAHRLGRLEIGETSVAIVVAAPHREAAFDACREAIDRLKRTVPIWKKEHFEDGEVWVEGEWDASVARS